MSEKIYELKGVNGKYLDVYEDKVVIKVKAGLGALFAGSAFNGEKTIYFTDCIGIQFKKAGLMNGYLQFETASGYVNGRGGNNFLAENSFVYEAKKELNIQMVEVAEYCKKQIEEYKTKKNSVAINEVSAADEIKKFKELLDSGIITDEEFNAKKKELLGL